MAGSVVIVFAVWLGICCLVTPLALMLVRIAARADEREDALQREEALRREVALNRLEAVRSPTGRRFFSSEDARRALEEVLK